MTDSKVAPRYKIQGMLGMNLHLRDVGPQGSTVTFEPGEFANRVSLHVSAEDDYLDMSGTSGAIAAGLIIPLVFLRANLGKKMSFVIQEIPGEVDQLELNVVD